MILDDIKTKLEEIDPVVFYGMVDEKVRETVWDYTVFNRTHFRSTGNKTGFADGYDVNIVRENFVPEGVDLQYIEKMQEINGMKLASSDGEYSYVMKPNTNIVVEILTLHFVRARK